MTQAEKEAVLSLRQQRYTEDFRQRIDGSPVHTLLLGPGEHGISPVVRTAIGTIFAGDAFIRSYSFQDSLPAARPGITFAAADTVGNDRLVGDVLLVPEMRLEP